MQFYVFCMFSVSSTYYWIMGTASAVFKDSGRREDLKLDIKDGRFSFLLLINLFFIIKK